MNTKRRARGLGMLMLSVVLGGCASFSRDGGFGDVQALARERIGEAPQWVRTERDVEEARERVRKLLAGTLTADAAVQIALTNNPGLQATYADLGIAEADLVQAGRLRNPGFSYSRLRRADELEIERLFMVDVLGLITMPIRTRLERQRFELTKLRVAAQVTRVAADTRRAYYRAIAAQEGASYAAQVQAAAEASAELARRMAAAGNISKLDHARDQVFYAEVTAQLARARQAVVSERERLTQLMGLWGTQTGYTLPARLPELPKTPEEIPDLEKSALQKRLDVQNALQEAESIAASLGLTRVTGFVNVLEVGYARNSETRQPRQTGYEIELRLPVFDWGGARAARAQHTYMQAVNRAADVAVRARSEVREAYAAYRTAFDIARHYRDEIVPVRKRMSDEMLLRYNAMLVSVFELLADARQQVAAVNTYIETVRDFWIADVNLQQAHTGSSPGAIAVPAGSIQTVGGDAEAGH